MVKPSFLITFGMLRALGLLPSGPTLTPEEGTRRIVFQALKLEKALKAMDYVLDDRPKESYRLLSDHDTVPISQLAYGVCEFLEATLGFEDQTMKHAAEILSKAEGMAWKEKGIAERNNLKASVIYPAGTEYTVAYAESNLLSALLMLMSESFMEEAKALLKLRRAYHALDALSKKMQSLNDGEFTTVREEMLNLGYMDDEVEENSEKADKSIKSNDSENSVEPSSIASEPKNPTMVRLLQQSATRASQSTPDLPAQFSRSSSNSSDSCGVTPHFVDVPVPPSPQQLKDKAVIDQLEMIYRMRQARIAGSHIGNPPVCKVERTHLGMHKDPVKKDGVQSSVVHYGDPRISSVDEYIHSGVNLCFGILQVVLSLLPPGLGRVLSVVGFKGSRERGLRMIWKAAQERNIHGGIGLLALLVFYDGPFQFTDVDFDVPSAVEDDTTGVETSGDDNDDDDGDDKSSTRANSVAAQKMELERKATRGDGDPTVLHPGVKLAGTLLHARALFPNSNLWLLQESRMLASHGRLEEALALLDSAKKNQMKQVDALMLFDRCMLLVFLHRYTRAAKEFLDLINVNSYSHALYTYFAGACYLECYRMCETGLFLKGDHKDSVDSTKKDEYLKLASKYLLKAPKMIGKKFLSRIPPFEKLIARKHKEVIQRQQRTGLPYTDCVGTSPIHELAYFWNGYNRMPEECLRLSIKLLGYSASSINDPELDLLNPKTDKPYAKFEEDEEQSMIRHTLQAISLRRLGKVKRGDEVLNKEVLHYISVSGNVSPTEKMRKLDKNPWLYPTALYEKALFCWKLKGIDGLDDSMEWLKKSQNFGGDDYELSTRISLKTKAAIDRLEDMNVDN